MKNMRKSYAVKNKKTIEKTTPLTVHSRGLGRGFRSPSVRILT
jgi:hypothetical protein